MIRTIGRNSDPRHIETASNALGAFLALGSVVVITFTAARVTQEAAKEGIFPFSVFLAAAYDFSFRHGFRRHPQHEYNFRAVQGNPIPALALNCVVTAILILATVVGGGTETASDGTLYVPGISLLGTACSYGLDMAWFAVIGAGMLCLRLWPGSNWRHKSPIPHALSVLSAVVFTATTAFPLAVIWVPNPTKPFLAGTNGKVPWFAAQTMTLAVLAAAGAYWVGFKLYLWQKRARLGQVLTVSRTIFFGHRYPGSADEWVFLYDICRLEWSVELEGRRSEAGVRGSDDLELPAARYG